MNPLELILKIDFQTDQFNRRLDELYRGMDQLYRGQNLFKSQMDQSNLIRPVSNHIEPGGLIRAENQAGFQDQAIRYAVACLRGMGVRVTEDALNELLSKWKEIEPDLSKFFSDLPQNVDNIIEEIVRKFRMQENPSGPGNIRSGPRGNPNKPETNLFMGPEHADTLIRNAEFLAAEHSAIWEREAENRIALLRRVLDELALLESAHGEEILLQQQTMRDREQALASDRVNFKRAALEDDIIAGTEHAETLIGMAETFAAERFAISERESEKQIALRKRELDEKARLEREHTETVLRPHEAMRRRQEELAREWTSLMQRALAGNLDDWRHWANLVIEIVRDVLLKQIEAQNATSGGGGFLSTIFSGLGLVISGGFGSFFRRWRDYRRRDRVFVARKRLLSSRPWLSARRRFHCPRRRRRRYGSVQRHAHARRASPGHAEEPSRRRRRDHRQHELCPGGSTDRSGRDRSAPAEDQENRRRCRPSRGADEHAIQERPFLIIAPVAPPTLQGAANIGFTAARIIPLRRR